MLTLTVGMQCTDSECVCVRAFTFGGGGPWRSVKHALCQIEPTALIAASINGRADCVRLLLDAGADQNAKNLVCISLCGAYVI